MCDTLKVKTVIGTLSLNTGFVVIFLVDADTFVWFACIDRCCHHGGSCIIGSQQM
jgi:hypothetical protein